MCGGGGGGGQAPDTCLLHTMYKRHGQILSPPHFFSEKKEFFKCNIHPKSQYGLYVINGRSLSKEELYI